MFILPLIVIFMLSSIYGGLSTKLLLIGALVYIYYLAWTSKNNVFVITVVFISTYIFYLIPYFFFNYDYATRQDYQVHDVAHISFHYLVAFVVGFLSVLYMAKKDCLDLDDRLPLQPNSVIYAFCISILLLFTALSINLSGTALTISYKEVTESRYAFIDYSLVFTLLAYVFAPTVRSKNLLLVVAVLYIMVSLVYGLRLRAIQMLILIFVLYYERRFSPKIVLSASFLGLVLMQLWGELRIGDDAFLQRDYVIVSNQGGVFLNANMYIGLVRDGYISSSERITTFLGNILSIGYSQSELPEKFNLAKLAGNFFSIPGGGLITGYLYVWGGVFGLLLGVLLISKIYSLMFSSSSNKFFMIYGVIIIATMPRWFAYSPIHFFKMGVWAVGLYFVFSIIDNRMIRNEKL